MSLFSPVLLAVAVVAPNPLLAQSHKPSVTRGDLLKISGLGSVPVGSMAQDFTLRDTNGQTFSLGARRGNLVFLNFWATWCGPCRQEMPSMERLHRALGNRGLVMLAVNQRESGAQVSGFMRRYGLTFPALLDSDGRVSSRYQIWSLPTTVLIDGSGQIIGKRSGPKDWASRSVVEAFERMAREAGNGGDTGGPLVVAPVEPLAPMLRVKIQGSSVHALQDEQSETLDKPGRGEMLIPLGKASGAGDLWYMVKTQGGRVGWVKGTDVEEVNPTK